MCEVLKILVSSTMSTTKSFLKKKKKNCLFYQNPLRVSRFAGALSLGCGQLGTSRCEKGRWMHLVPSTSFNPHLGRRGHESPSKLDL